MYHSRDSALCGLSRSENIDSPYSSLWCSSVSRGTIDYTDFLLSYLALVTQLLLHSMHQVHPSPPAIVALLLRFCVFSFDI